MNQIRIPNVANVLKQDKFVLTILAYRKLSYNETVLAAEQYLKTIKRRTLPKSGSATFVTTIGHDRF